MASNKNLANVELSGIGGIETWKDALEYILLGCKNVQITTAIMQYTNMGNVTYAFALGLILLLMALIFNILVFIFQNKVSKNGSK